MGGPESERQSPADFGEQPSRVLIYLSGGLLILLSLALAAGFDIVPGDAWLRFWLTVLLAAMLLSASVLARRQGQSAFGLAVYLASLALTSTFVPVLVGVLTQGGQPSPPSSAPAGLLAAVIGFGAVSLYFSAWDAPPVSAALVFSGASVLLRTVQLALGPLSLAAAPWALVVYGIALCLSGALFSRRPTAADHPFWITLAGLAIVSLWLPSAVPWYSAAGWVYPLLLLLLGLLLLRSGRRFLGTLALLAVAFFLSVEGYAVAPALGISAAAICIAGAIAAGLFWPGPTGDGVSHGTIWT